jgi:Tfp pilus assembly protein PilF
VSLLLDALRKAEQQKQQLAQQEQPAAAPVPEESKPAGNLELELMPHADAQPPRPAASGGHDHLPELPSRMEDLDEQFMAHAPKAQRLTTTQKAEERAAIQPPRPVQSPTQATKEADAARAGARLMFEAKQPPQKSNSFAITAGVLGVVAAAGIGGYVWWEMQPKGGLAAGVPLASPPATPMPIAPVASAPAAPSPAPAVPPQPTFTAPAEPLPVTAETVARQPAAKPPALPAGQSESSSPIRVTKAIQKTDPLLDQAYLAFERGDLDQARTAWEKALAADPRNADALHGLAATALQRQQPGAAIDYYLRALEADPKDALALAGLLSLKTPGDAQQTESKLKLLLAERPDSPYLNFALGNLYARDARWAEAQQAYFKAHTADAANPDFLFNLAVSLDQLHQPRLAIQYYNQAIAAAARQPAGFDAGRAAVRLRDLQAAQP